MSQSDYLIAVVWKWIKAHKFVSLVVAVGLALFIAALFYAVFD